MRVKVKHWLALSIDEKMRLLNAVYEANKVYQVVIPRLHKIEHKKSA